MVRHAVILHRAGAYPTAAAVALLGREELGAYRFLREEWQKAVETGVVPDADAVRTKLRNHEFKQRCAMGSLTYMSEGGGRFDKLARTVAESHPASEEHRKAASELNAALKRMGDRAPGQRHAARMRALYVDLQDSGAGWNRPVNLSRREATRSVLEAMNYYAIVYDRLRPEMVIASMHEAAAAEADREFVPLPPKFAAALAAWTDKPVLPEPDFAFRKFP
jgi:AbiV family abortive infection protein